MNKDSKKARVQIKDVPYIYLDYYLIEGDINEVSDKILTIKNKLKEAYDLRDKDVANYSKRDFITTFTPFEDYQYIVLKSENVDGYRELSISVWRDETDEECNRRLATSKKISESLKLAATNRRLAQEKRENIT